MHIKKYLYSLIILFKKHEIKYKKYYNLTFFKLFDLKSNSHEPKTNKKFKNSNIH